MAKEKTYIVISPVNDLIVGDEVTEKVVQELGSQWFREKEVSEVKNTVMASGDVKTK